MAEVKWIKIVTDIFDDEKILLIESIPEADSIIVIWFKLLCLAGKTNNSGVFMLNDKIPYTDEMLATIFRRKVNTVKLALDTFEKFGMIKIINNVITIPNWSKHQSLDKIEARNEYMRQYMAEYREKQKHLAMNKNSKVNSKVNVNALEEDIEEEIDIDKEEDKNIIEDKSSMSVETDLQLAKSNVNYQKVMDYWNKNSKLKEITVITEKRKGHLNARIKEHGIDAIYKAIDNVANSAFLRGENNRGWIANFDWVFKPNNFIKVLEGNYLDKTPNDFENDIARRAEKIKSSWGGLNK